MSYWFGFRVVEVDGSNPGSKCLEGPFTTYGEAKKVKETNRARDMEQTPIFPAESKIKAELQLEREIFSRL